MTHRGLIATRCAIAKAMGGVTPDEVEAYARNRWGRAEGSMIAKAGVSGGGTGTGEWGAELTADSALAELIELAEMGSILDLLPGVRRVPSQTPIIALGSGATAYWRGQSKALKVSAPSLNRTALSALSLGATLVLSNELLADSRPEAELFIRDELARAIRQLLDSQFIDPALTGVATVSPASVTSGATPISSTNDPANDCKALLAAFGGSLSTAAFISSPKLAAQMCLRAAGRGVGSDAGARGGTLAGLPLIVSEACPGALLALVDGGAVALCDEGAVLGKSDDGMVELNTAPTGATDTPVAASATMVSLWQSDSSALKVTRRINWMLARSGSVSLISDASYA